MPPRTRGTSSAPTYLRRPGLLTRFRPVIADVLFTNLFMILSCGAFLGRLEFEVGDVAFLLQNAGDFALDFGVGDGDFGLARAGGIAQAREKVCDGIGHWLIGSS